MKQIILIVGHGSRSKAAIEEFNDFVSSCAQRVQRPIQTCFMELVEPDLASGLSKAATEAGLVDGGEVVVLPLFLGAANHQKNDVAVGVQWARAAFPKITFRYGMPLEPHANLVRLVDLRIQEAHAADSDALPLSESAILLVGRGSSDPDSNSEVSRTARLLFESGMYATVETAFQAVARPDIEDGIYRCKKLGAMQVIVVPYVIFTGFVEEDILKKSLLASQKVSLPLIHTRHLGVHPLLVETAGQRINEAISQNTYMNCDICKYRFPIAPYEEQVGSAQVSHHLHGGK